MPPADPSSPDAGRGSPPRTAADGRVTCRRCGRVSEPDGGLTWTFDASDGRAGYVCPSCTRDNVRAIEGRLDEDWW